MGRVTVLATQEILTNNRLKYKCLVAQLPLLNSYTDQPPKLIFKKPVKINVMAFLKKCLKPRDEIDKISYKNMYSLIGQFSNLDVI